MAHDEKTGAEVPVKLTDEEHFAGLAFKMRNRSFCRQLGILSELRRVF